ncbi:uncharacterized protein LOC133904606 [Phragmites australis]|uniref:uncharacterized protein LOC133904606 n=1 Tax=Phragmites australis TaxID=29695 RepID=UPI002D78B9AD|nr:uncharacterized protein LOC133904606 [Phragmites australis]
MEEFVDFCKSKRAIYRKKMGPHESKLDHMIQKDINHHIISPSASGSSKFSVSYFSKVIESLTQHQRNVIEKYGMGCLLKFENCYVPKKFAKWIARHIDANSSEIKLAEKSIPICKEFVHIVLDLPIGGNEIILNREAGRSYLLSKFHLNSIPSVTYFGNMLQRIDISDETIFSCFMIVALSSFLAPNSSMKPSSKYLSVLQDISSVHKFDWSKFVYDWLMTSISKFNNKSKSTGKSCKTLGGCIYFIAVYYLDFINFGIHFIPRDIPRISVWKGDMIKIYSKRDQLDNRNYERKPIKNLSKTCYSKIEYISQRFSSGQNDDSSHHTSDFNHKLEDSFGDILTSKVNDSLCDLVYESYSKKCENCKVKADSLVLSVLHILSNAIGSMNEEHALNNGNSDVAVKKSVDCNEAIDHSQTNIRFLSTSKGCISEFERSYTPTEILQSSNGYSNEHSPNKEVTQHVADDGTFKKSPASYHLGTNEQCSIGPAGESSPAKSNVDVKADDVPNVDNQLADLILSKLCKLDMFFFFSSPFRTSCDHFFFVC